jgi:hypothetical protein
MWDKLTTVPRAGSDNRRVKHHSSSDAKSALASLELLICRIFIREVGGISM